MVPEARRKSRDRAIGDSSGSGKAAGEGRRDESGRQMRKGDEVDQFAYKRNTRTASFEETGGLAPPDGCEEGPLRCYPSLASHLRAFVKAACGKTARAVWAADGGQRLRVRLLRPDRLEAGKASEAPRGRKAGQQIGRAATQSTEGLNGPPAGG